MGKINLLLIFLIFVAYVMASPMLITTNRPCPKVPAKYCENPVLKQKCDKTKICDRYDISSPCLQGPEVFCKTEKLKAECQRRAYCLTYPNDDGTVIAYRRKTDSLTDTHYANRGIYFILPNY